MKLPKVVIAAVITSFLLGTAALASARVRAGSLPGALVLIAAGFTLLKRRSWGGYGPALVSSSQVLLFPILFVHNSSLETKLLGLWAAFALGLALLFFLAGKALSQAGAIPGARWPWIVLSVLLSAPFLFVRAYIMPTGSMEDTLLIGDHVLVRVFPRPIPKRGHLLVFRYPLDAKQIFVKRVIGVGGDRIRMKDRVLYRNGSALTEPYVTHRFPFDAERVRQSHSCGHAGNWLRLKARCCSGMLSMAKW